MSGPRRGRCGPGFRPERNGRFRALGGVLSGCLLLALSLASAGCGEGARPRHAILIVLDTLRADRLSAYGNPRVTTPAIDALAAEGVLFERAVTHVTWTLPSMSALLTAEYPPFHPTRAVAFSWPWFSFLERSLVAPLREAGFLTAAFAEGGFASKQYGFGHGFQLFEEHEGIRPPFVAHRGKVMRVPRHEAGPREPAAEGAARRSKKEAGDADDAADRGIARTFGAAQRWLEHHDGEPFFLMLHTYEPHMPYRRRRYAEGMNPGRLGSTFEFEDSVRAGRPDFGPTEAELDYINALYDGGVATCDRYVAELVATLERLGLRDDTLLVITSDHGEELDDRSPPRPGRHGDSLYDEQLRVPLIVVDPTRPGGGRRVATQVRTLDVMPTILERLGVEVPPGKAGRSLGPLLVDSFREASFFSDGFSFVDRFWGGEEQRDRALFLSVHPRMTHKVPSLVGLGLGREKLIVAGTPGVPERVELYDLKADPEERNNLASDRRERTTELLTELRQVADALPRLPALRPGEAPEPEPELRERLRALGYAE